MVRYFDDVHPRYHVYVRSYCLCVCMYSKQRVCSIIIMYEYVYNIHLLLCAVQHSSSSSSQSSCLLCATAVCSVKIATIYLLSSAQFLLLLLDIALAKSSLREIAVRKSWAQDPHHTCDAVQHKMYASNKFQQASHVVRSRCVNTCFVHEVKLVFEHDRGGGGGEVY